MRKLTFLLLYLILIAALAAGCLSVVKRINIEAENSSVEIAMDWQDIKRLSLADGIPMNQLLDKLKNAGVTTIAIPEETLETLELDGKLAWLTGYEQRTLLDLARPIKVKTKVKLPDYVRKLASPILKSLLRASKQDPDLSYVYTADKQVFSRVKKELLLMLGEKQVRQFKPGMVSVEALEVTDYEEDLMGLGLGISSELGKRLSDHGFLIVPRIKNNFRLDAVKFSQKIKDMREAFPFSTVIFDGEEVGGYRSNVISVAKALRKTGINYGYIELSVQKGDREFLKTMKTRIVRVHSISEDEMKDKMTIPEAIDRFDRAVTERGIRLLFVRPFYSADKGAGLADTNISYISKIRQNVFRSMHRSGKAGKPADFSSGMKPIMIFSLGIGAGALLLLSAFVRMPLWLIYAVLAASLLAPVPFRMSYQLVLFRKLAALAAAVVFPSLSITAVFRKKNIENVIMPVSRSILMTLASFFLAFTGAVMVIGLLSDTRFMLGSQQFMGIKLAFILPIAVAALYAWHIEEEGSKESLMQWLNSPITLMNILIGAVLLGAAALYLVRSGNFGIGILESEKVARGFLENIMVVRPRTKEFLVGYPVLFLGAAYYLKGGRKWLWAFLLVGVIGPISTLNTFCHIHSPLLISILRSVYGVLIGTVLGVLAFWIWALFDRFSRK